MAFVTNAELVKRGVPQTAIDRAVADRKLRAVSLGNGAMSFDADQVERWLTGQAGETRSPHKPR